MKQRHFSTKKLKNKGIFQQKSWRTKELKNKKVEEQKSWRTKTFLNKKVFKQRNLKKKSLKRKEKCSFSFLFKLFFLNLFHFFEYEIVNLFFVFMFKKIFLLFFLIRDTKKRKRGLFFSLFFHPLFFVKKKR